MRHAMHTPLLALLLACAGSARADDAPLEVAATLPYLADVIRAVGGDRVHVVALAAPGLDPHFIMPTPAHALTLSKAQAFIETGFNLELWSERVIDGARNQAIRPGSPGHTYAGVGIRPLQVPRQQTRASGDVHVAGNPHVWLDPLNLKHIAINVERVLSAVSPADQETFAANRRAFAARIDEAFYGPDLVRVLGAGLLDRLQQTGRLRQFLRDRRYQERPLLELAGGWLKRAIALDGLKVISYHQVWTYFQDAFGVEVAATIEEKPGIPPSPAHLEHLEEVARSTGARLVICAPFYPFGRAEGVAERIGGQALALPTQPGEVDPARTGDVFAMFDFIFDRLEEAQRALTERR